MARIFGLNYLSCGGYKKLEPTLSLHLIRIVLIKAKNHLASRRFDLLLLLFLSIWHSSLVKTVVPRGRLDLHSVRRAKVARNGYEQGSHKSGHHRLDLSRSGD